MFFQVRNTLRFVSIEPCHLMKCECFNKLKPLVRGTNPNLSKNEYHRYKKCYRKSGIYFFLFKVNTFLYKQNNSCENKGHISFRTEQYDINKSGTVY